MKAILHGNKLIIQAEDDFRERIFLQELYRIPETILRVWSKEQERVTFTYCKETKTLEIKRKKEVT